MHLEKYLSTNEKVLYSFYGSIRLLVVQLLSILFVFAGLTYLYWIFFQSWILGVIVGGFVFCHTFFIFLNSWYFVTNKKVYKRTGYLWTKIVDTEFRDITDTNISQNFFQRILSIGTISFNTSGLNTIEIVFENIDNPFDVNRNISDIMNN